MVLQVKPLFIVCVFLQIPSYSLVISAMDRGIPPMSSTVMVNIDVSDINDNPPTFSLSSLTAVTQVNLIITIEVINQRKWYIKDIKYSL